MSSQPTLLEFGLNYDVAYYARGQSENFIKEFKNALHADRSSCHRFVANAFRRLLHAIAYRLMHALRATVSRVAPAVEYVSTDRVRRATAQMDTLRLRLLKVAAHVTASVRVSSFACREPSRSRTSSSPSPATSASRSSAVL